MYFFFHTPIHNFSFSCTDLITKKFRLERIFFMHQLHKKFSYTNFDFFPVHAPTCTATRCNTQQHSATLCRTVQHTASHCNTLQLTENTHSLTLLFTGRALQHTATHCNALQHTATHCSTLQHSAALCSTLQHSAAHCKTLEHIGDTHLPTRVFVLITVKLTFSCHSQTQTLNVYVDELRRGAWHTACFPGLNLRDGSICFEFTYTDKCPGFSALVTPLRFLLHHHYTPYCS